MAQAGCQLFKGSLKPETEALVLFIIETIIIMITTIIILTILIIIMMTRMKITTSCDNGVLYLQHK